jgi:Caudovirales tail fibre assembly protein.
MPYAANDKIAENKFDGAIEITIEQYALALEGMCAGLVVTIDEGFKVSEPTPSEPEPIPELTPEEVVSNAAAQRDQLLRSAATRIAPLQDAVDLGGDASDGDVASLKQWKQYRVALNRIEQQTGFPVTVDWPTAPG